MRVLIAASGGGHTGHAVAIAQHLVEKGISVDFVVPRGDRWSASRVRRYGRVVSETVKPVIPGEKRPNVLRLGLGVVDALLHIPGDYDVVVSTGSSHSVMAALAGLAKAVPVVHVEVSERLASLSSATRVLAPFSRLLVLQWPEQLHLLPRGRRRRAVLVGPVYEKPRYPSRDEGYVLVAGGTYGYPELFDAVAEAGFSRVVMQTGRVDPSRYRRPGWRVFRFDPDLHRWIAGASVVVSHFGRTVVDAALTYGKPVVIVPNPRWSLARGAGFHDAVLLARRLRVVIAPFSAIRSPRRLREIIEEAASLRPRRYPNGGPLLAELLRRLYGS